MSRKVKISIPYISWRDGKPRFDPGANIRALGYSSMSLRHPLSGKIEAVTLEPGTKNSGQWFSADEALAWSEMFAARLQAGQSEKPSATARPAPVAARQPRPRKSLNISPRGTYPLSRLIEDWQRSPAFKEDVSEKTRKDYRSKMNVLAETHPDVWASEVDALDRVICHAIFEQMRKSRGLAMARGVIRVLSTAITWGLNRGKFRIRDTNPCHGLRMKTTEPRVRFASRPELESLVAVADLVGRHDMGDSFTLAVWSGQRQNDRLQLTIQNQNVRRLTLKQNKTGALVSLPLAPQIQQRLAASHLRRKAANVISTHVILFEKTWNPFNVDTYHHYFSEIRRIAVFGLWRTVEGNLSCPVNERFKHLRHVATGPINGECLVKPCPSLRDFHEADFRDTAVTWLALAGSTVPEICSVTGHSVQSATQVLRHYLAMHPEMADNAICKMVEWYDADGETEL